MSIGCENINDTAHVGPVYACLKYGISINGLSNNVRESKGLRDSAVLPNYATLIETFLPGC